MAILLVPSEAIRQETYDTAQCFLDEGDPVLRRFPRPVKAIARHWGFSVIELPDHVVHLDHGMIIENLIVVAKRRKVWERRLTIAHELGHYVLGETATEEECTVFGSSLLIPADDLSNALNFFIGPGPYSVERLAESEAQYRTMSILVQHFGTGYKALLWAITDYGLVEGIPKWHGGEQIYTLMAEYRNAWRQSVLRIAGD